MAINLYVAQITDMPIGNISINSRYAFALTEVYVFASVYFFFSNLWGSSLCKAHKHRAWHNVGNAKSFAAIILFFAFNEIILN